MLVDLAEVEFLRGELAGVVQAEPFQPFRLFRVFRIGEDLDQVLVSPHAAAVVGWGRTPPADTYRVGGRWVGECRLLDQDVVFPVVAEVIGVANLVLDRWRNLFEGDRGIRAVPEVTVGAPELAVRGVEDVRSGSRPLSQSGQSQA